MLRSLNYVVKLNVTVTKAGRILVDFCTLSDTFNSCILFEFIAVVIAFVT